MWFLFAILTTLAWALADLFCKKGTDSEDKVSHLKIVTLVGLAMGIHGVIYMLYKGITFNPIHMINYFPVSFLYILSMAIGYAGLRYIELSISSPVQNSSGAITVILGFIFFKEKPGILEILGTLIITLGVFWLGYLENKEAKQLVDESKINRKYRIGFIALICPILYAIIDALGTFADGLYLYEYNLISEVDALLAYEFTFFIVGVICYIYLKFIKKEKFNIFRERDKAFYAIFEVIGQFFYVFAIAKNPIISAGIISSYSIFSVILSRIFLKEKLSKGKYGVIAFVMLGIVILGILDV